MNKIYIGDSRDVLSQLGLENQVALMITSPPYYVGRGYKNYIESRTEYWRMIWYVLEETASLIEPFGKMAINFADKYANAKEHGRPFEICYIANYTVIMNMLGFDLWARIIWNKNRLPDGARHVTAKSRFEGQMRVCPDWEYIFVWRKLSEGKPPKKQVTMTKDEWRIWSKGVWNIDPVRRNATVGSTKLAVFPYALPMRLIHMYTEPDDIVLDPFCGAGTTVKAARHSGRFGVGIEKNPEMLSILMENLQHEMFLDNVAFIKAP